jgi:hypothetical protein
MNDHPGKAPIAMRRFLAAIAAVVVMTASLSGCTKHPFFGTDMPSQSPTAASCPDPIAAPPTREPASPPGKIVSQISVTFAAVRFGTDPNDPSKLQCDLEVPLFLRVHIYATVDGSNVFLSPDGGTLPWDAHKTTPWSTTFYLSHPAGTAPLVMMDASATVLDSPSDPAPQDVTLHCIVRYGMNPVAHDPTGPPLPKGNRFVHCQAAFPVAV